MTPHDLPSTLAGFEEIFEGVLEPGPLGYYKGGATDETTLRDNVLAWKRWRIHPNVLRDVSQRDLSTALLGSRHAHPVIVAPTAYHRLAHPQGEVATALGSAQADAIHTLSTLANCRPAEVKTAGARPSVGFRSMSSATGG